MAENPFDMDFEGVPTPNFGRDSDSFSRSLRWEHQVMRQVLGFFGLKAQGAVLADLTHRRTGVRMYSFRQFKEAYPSFPVWLECRRVPNVHELQVGDFVRDWTKTRLWKAFESAEADAPEAHREGNFGLAFEWLHAWKFAVIHNRYHATALPETVLFRNFPGTDPPQLVAVQSLTSFLTSLHWQGGG